MFTLLLASALAQPTSDPGVSASVVQLSDEAARPALEARLGSTRLAAGQCMKNAPTSSTSTLRFTLREGTLDELEIDGPGSECLAGLVRRWELDELPSELEATVRYKRLGTMLISVLGTRGSSGGTVQDLFADPGAAADLDAALRGVGGVAVAGEEGASTAPLPPTRVEVEVVEVPEAQRDALRKTANKYKGQVRYCYEQALREDPTLEGRLEATLTLEAGRASAVALTANHTGHEPLGRCVENKARRWRYSPELQGEVVLSWVLHAGDPAP